MSKNMESIRADILSSTPSEMECPICGNYRYLNALSRRDNDTEICDECAQEEAMEDMFGVVKDKDGTWHIDPSLL